jgi:hypothetical protein
MAASRCLAATTGKPTPYGIDLKNPFTMSKTLTALEAALPLRTADLFSLHLWISALRVVELIGIEPMT